jgi:hypothetical protein
MTRIGILSDTHCFLHAKVFEFFAECDQIWHAGDIGNTETAENLEKFKPLTAVHGNIDGQQLRQHYPETQLFTVEQLKVFITHIGGKPGKYDFKARQIIENEKPGIFVCGHSHICRVQYDHKYKMLYINPGAAGKFGMHQKITLLRFIVDRNDMRDMEILELDKH